MMNFLLARLSVFKTANNFLHYNLNPHIVLSYSLVKEQDPILKQKIEIL